MKVVHTQSMEWEQGVSQGKFSQRRKGLGGQRLSCGLWELPAGKFSFPMHKHHATEEAMFVVSGTAKVRTPEGDTPIGPGDFVSFPPAGTAHHLVNDGAEPLVYLGMSATTGIDIVEYPNSGKVACSTGPRPDGKRFVFRAKDQVDYWEGES